MAQQPDVEKNNAGDVQAVIFDLDGIIIDSESLDLLAFNLMLSRYHSQYQLSEEAFGLYFVGVPTHNCCKMLKKQYDLPCTNRELIAEHEAIYMALIQDSANLVAMPGLLDLLDVLAKKEVLLAVASGSERTKVKSILSGLNIIGRFQAVLTGSDVVRLKPAPDVYLRAIEELCVLPRKCLAIEDSAVGVASAKAAGLSVVAIPNRFTRHQDLSLADAQVANLYNVLQFLFP